MSRSQLDTLIHMVNQIALNVDYEEDEQAAERVATHLKKFWARSMKQQLIAYAEADGSALYPAASKAVEMLAETTPKAN